MAIIKVQGYEVSSDPGIQNFSSYKGQIDVKDIAPDQNLAYVPENPWWRSDIAHRFARLLFVEMRPEGALLRYGDQEMLVEYGKSKQIDEVGLSYAYGELWVEVIKD